MVENNFTREGVIYLIDLLPLISKHSQKTLTEEPVSSTSIKLSNSYHKIMFCLIFISPWCIENMNGTFWSKGRLDKWNQAGKAEIENVEYANPARGILDFCKQNQVLNQMLNGWNLNTDNEKETPKHVQTLKRPPYGRGLNMQERVTFSISALPPNDTFSHWPQYSYQ